MDYNSLLSSYSQAAKLARWGIPEPAARLWQSWPGWKSAGSPWRWKCFSATSCRKCRNKKEAPIGLSAQWGIGVALNGSQGPSRTVQILSWAGLLPFLVDQSCIRSQRPIWHFVKQAPIRKSSFSCSVGAGCPFFLATVGAFAPG